MASGSRNHFKRIGRLVGGALNPAPGPGRMIGALALGCLMHLMFALAVLAMIWAMFWGMSRSFGTVPSPWSWLVNLALLLQFPLAHSVFLNGAGARLIPRVVPGRWGPVLATTTFALLASLQLAALFLLWTPSGIVWWRADGMMFWVLGGAYTAAWALLVKASWDAGAEVQSGALGWMTMFAGRRRAVYPPMPQRGSFRLIRQPIYLSFALTLWTVPVWTPDQVLVAIVLTGYCLAAPVLKERRFAARYGVEWHRYRRSTPYMLPRGSGRASHREAADG